MPCSAPSTILVCAGFLLAACERPDTRAVDGEFRDVVLEGASLVKLAGGMRLVEGPVWMPAGEGFLVFSDILSNEIKRWSAGGGLGVFRSESPGPNGNALDREGRLLTCQQEARCITRTEPDGTVTVLCERYDGKRLNSPNDIAVRSDGSIWFTDPPFGLGRRQKELDGNYVFRLAPDTLEPTIAIEDFERPNGLCFSPDDRVLYVSDSSRRQVWAFEVTEGGLLARGRLFADTSPAAPDGLRCDAEGRLYCSSGDGVRVYAPDGRLLGWILVPEAPSSVCFGGSARDVLYITAGRSLYRIQIAAKGR